PCSLKPRDLHSFPTRRSSDLPNLLAAVTVHWLALPLFGMHVPFVTLLTFLPLVFFFAALPIAAAHLGPSQAAWVYFFRGAAPEADRKSTRLNSSHQISSYAVF